MASKIKEDKKTSTKLKDVWGSFVEVHWDKRALYLIQAIKTRIRLIDTYVATESWIF